MSFERIFIDTSYVQAILDRRDALHERALALRPFVERAAEFWLTDAILIEVGNALASRNRGAATEFIESCHLDRRFRVISVNKSLLLNALSLYRKHDDKTWGITDCLSFVVMKEQELTIALTADRHFIQAGFRALLLENS